MAAAAMFDGAAAKRRRHACRSGVASSIANVSSGYSLVFERQEAGNVMVEVEGETSGGAREYITFRMGSQHYCIDIMSVREIRGWTPATAVPRAPRFVRGVINLRGLVLPIVDLADRLGFAPTQASPRHVIIVVQTPRQIVGLLVDAVSDIVAVASEKVHPTPDVGSDEARGFVLGVMPIEEKMISLIAPESVMPTFVGEAA